MLPLSAAPCDLASALEARGFDSLTSIQSAVIDADARGRDLRLTSQTGSGKTVAVGLAMAEVIAEGPNHRGIARPTALIVAPTRELAAQLARELSWLYEPLRKKVSVVTGGTSLTAEKRELKQGPHVLVGTPGRLLDHLRHGAISLETLKVVVLDEADEMLDMGFEEELNAILDFAPAEKQTHLVSATFSGQALRLAQKLQSNPLAVEGTPLGAANSDIEHRCILAHPGDHLDVIVNLLLRFEGDKSLIFVRTRASTLELAHRLADLGFSALPLSGEMTQRERTNAFDRFRRGTTQVLVATDVAARGVDVHDIAQVIQADLPDDSEVLTHRSGRTGRAGRTGRNVMLVAPRARRRVESLMRQAKVRGTFVDAPDPDSIRAAAEARLAASLKEKYEPTERLGALAKTLLEEADPVELVERLLARISHDGPTAPRELSRVRKADKMERPRRDDRSPRHDTRGPRRHEGKKVPSQHRSEPSPSEQRHGKQSQQRQNQEDQGERRPRRERPPTPRRRIHSLSGELGRRTRRRSTSLTRTRLPTWQRRSTGHWCDPCRAA